MANNGSSTEQSPRGVEKSEAERLTSNVLTIDQAVSAYAGEWILMEVTDADESHSPRSGIVVDHRPSRDEIQGAVLRVISSAEHVEHGYYLFYGYRRIRSGADWDEFRRMVKRRGDGRGRRP